MSRKVSTWLKDKSRKRITQSNETPEKIVHLIVSLREDHPSWGPKKLRPILKGTWHRMKQIPSETTIGNILRKKRPSQPKKKRPRVPQSLFPFSNVVAPNDVWCVDFKGHFTVGNGNRCDPLTITDAYSRYLLACEILNKTNAEQTKAVFERVFKEYGLYWRSNQIMDHLLQVRPLAA
ncbi:hypothetical protein LEP1GSC199_0115 [Leptospira vanthielii serovar Holland str. Waz Holland = ATCC 700522]|uniref:Integrase catalytic domain-containing protein n=1 Tax=Leptospira vanthielii serovar Holland str. Waz Holland = ATCC 700522 TaxID=1218591 RepID=N1W3J3_9LEPT|nr:DDE-type integrase/transposase/recombinase [Leptospira vanthielii]EMY67802.1 hypothetical protein LEP1GSC199_0115 [Leptospira vanthielii serovar Holland str. Waz Holland = ATCC 700522]